MSKENKPKRKKRKTRIEKIEITGTPAGLARTHKIIRSERNKEIQFMQLCSQIRLDDYKKERSERQKEERRAKR